MTSAGQRSCRAFKYAALGLLAPHIRSCQVFVYPSGEPYAGSGLHPGGAIHPGGGQLGGGLNRAPASGGLGEPLTEARYLSGRNLWRGHLAGTDSGLDYNYVKPGSQPCAVRQASFTGTPQHHRATTVR
jgi:hypothetical protein